MPSPTVVARCIDRLTFAGQLNRVPPSLRRPRRRVRTKRVRRGFSGVPPLGPAMPVVAKRDVGTEPQTRAARHLDARSLR